MGRRAHPPAAANFLLAGLPLLLPGLLLLQQLPACTTAAADSAAPSKIEGPQAAAAVVAYHPRMSCYACTTMDYESTTDNICRSLRPHQRYAANAHQQPSGSHLHFAHQNPIATSTAASASLNQAAPAMNQDNGAGGVSASSSASASTFGHNQDASAAAASSMSKLGGLGGDSNHVSSGSTVAPLSAAPTSATASAASAQQLQHSRPPAAANGIANNGISNRTMFPHNYIRTRPCLEDENFCSIVSVVRIEFVQDNIYSKFWALERNCSKSCNTGCMVIGERVRLRVCSQCCRTPNCNVGNGAPASLLGQQSNYGHRLLSGALLSLSTCVLVLIAAQSHQTERENDDHDEVRRRRQRNAAAATA